MLDSRQLEAVWRVPGRATRAVIDLDAIAANVKAVRARAGQAPIMAVVKADAYGHGAVPVAETALESGAAALAVATVEEGVRLRDACIHAPILVLGPVDRAEVEVAVGRGLELAVGDITTVEEVADAVDRLADGVAAPVHLKIDTGMRRFGAEPDEALRVAKFIAGHPALRLRGVFTHYARADEPDDEPTARQTERFDRVLRQLAGAGIAPELVHASNTAAVLRARPYVRGLIRLGIGMYGLDPSRDVPVAAGMRPALTWISRIKRVFWLAPGDGVSYGATYRASAHERAALVPVGYADGYRRGFSNIGWMGVGGERCPVRGRICMDQAVIAVPGEGRAAVNDTVVIASATGGDAGPRIDDLAAWAGTINYEIVAGLSPRVPRIYLKGGAVVAVADGGGYRTVSESGERT